jgi:phosphate transport system ATP-binding protein
VDLTFRQHETRRVIGPSGVETTVCGVSNRMNDLIESARVRVRSGITGGSVYPQVNAVEVRRRIGMVFQKPNPFPKSIYDNVAYGPAARGHQAQG